MIQFSDTEIVASNWSSTARPSSTTWVTTSSLRDCTIVFRIATRALVIAKVRFINCTIDVKRELVNFRWTYASLVGCRFRGRISGSDFGYWRDSAATWEHASISDCDFSGARLDCCRFHRCDTRTLKFPRWPCFTILDSIPNYWKLRSVEWPGSFGRLVIDAIRRDPPSTVALTFHAPSIAKQTETTTEAIRELVEKFDCILY